MRIEVVVPQIGEAVAALKLLAWLKSPGDRVEKGDVLFEIDSDKAVVEVESFVSGTLSEILALAGSDVMPQQVVAHIETAVEVKAAALPEPPGKTYKASPVAQRLASELGVNLAKVAGSGPGGRIITQDIRQFAGHTDAKPDGAVRRANASPLAKRLARESGIDLASVAASHTDGMIRAHDVELAAKATLAPPPLSINGTQPLSKLRQTIAQRTQASKQTVPHFYLMTDVEMTQAQRLRAYCRDTLAWEKPPTYTGLLLRACALALKDMPAVNQSYTSGGLLPRECTNIGVAVDTPAGLIVPVILDVDKRSLRQVALDLHNAAERARKGALKPADMGEKSMVISNLGMYTVDTFIAIIDQPDPMILAVGRVAERFVPVHGQPVIMPMCTLTLSADHRVLDGAAAARFLEHIKAHLENPYTLLG